MAEVSAELWQLAAELQRAISLGIFEVVEMIDRLTALAERVAQQEQEIAITVPAASRGPAQAQGWQESARDLRRRIGTVVSVLERKSQPNNDEQAMLRTLREWEHIAVQLGWPTAAEGDTNGG